MTSITNVNYRLSHDLKTGRTEWDLELWGELHRLADFDYATCSGVVEETLKVQNENGRQRFDEDLLARFA